MGGREAIEQTQQIKAGENNIKFEKQILRRRWPNSPRNLVVRFLLKFRTTPLHAAYI